jgi:hypothetical protein
VPNSGNRKFIKLRANKRVKRKKLIELQDEAAAADLVAATRLPQLKTVMAILQTATLLPPRPPTEHSLLPRLAMEIEKIGSQADNSQDAYHRQAVDGPIPSRSLPPRSNVS